VQSAHRDAVGLADTADLGALGRRHAPCIVTEGEGRDLEAGVAEPCGELTLALERQFADDLVAQGQFHRMDRHVISDTKAMNSCIAASA
jgi:hypothetical protein